MTAPEAAVILGFDDTIENAIATLRESADHLAVLVEDMPDYSATQRAHEDRITTSRDICERVSGEQWEAIRDLATKIEEHIKHDNPHDSLHHRIANLEQARTRWEIVLQSNTGRIGDLESKVDDAVIRLDERADGNTINDSDWHRRFDERLRVLEKQTREAEHQLPLLDERSHKSRIGLIDAKSAIAKLESRVNEMEQLIADFINPALSDCGEFDNLMIGRINRLEDRMDRKARPYPTYDGPVIAEGDHAYLNREMRRAVDEFRRRVEAILEGCDPMRVPF